MKNMRRIGACAVLMACCQWAAGTGWGPVARAAGAENSVTLEMVPLGAVVGTGGGHYAPLPVITNGGKRTFVAVAKGSRVQGYVDGQPGPVVNTIPAMQVLPIAGFVGIGTAGSPQFSVDQKRVAYIVGLDSGKQAVVVDATMSPMYEANNPIRLFFAPVGHHFAYVVGRQNGSESFVVDDGKAGLIYQGVSSERFSPDGKHFAFVGSTPDKGLTPLEVQAGRTEMQNICVVRDGAEQKHFAKIERLVFSQDGQHLGYLAGIDQLNPPSHAVVDDKVGPAYLGVHDLVLSDDASHSAYVAVKLFPKKETHGSITSDQSYKYDIVVVDGKEGPAFDTGPTLIQTLRISHDGQRVAYVVTTYDQNQPSHTVIVDNGKPSQQYTNCQNLQISPDGKTLVYVVAGAQGAIVVVNGQEFGPFASTQSNPVFSDDGAHWACCISTGEQKFGILEDGKAITLTGIAPGTLSFQPGTGQLLMRSTTSYSGMPVTFEVKGDAMTAADVPSGVAYSPNHQHLGKVFTTGYGTSEVKQKVAIDDQPPLAGDYAGIQSVNVSDDGKHVAFIGSYIGENGKPLIHANYDGTEGPGYWGIQDLALSPDGKHVAYVAQKSNGHGIDVYVVVDGLEGPILQDVLIDGAFTGQGVHANNEFRQVRFEPDGSLHFLPVMKGELYRAWYPAGSFNGLPSLAANEAQKPGPRDVHNFVRPNVFSDPATAMHFVLAPDDTLYGISDSDGKFNKGTLFKVKTDGTGFVVLHDFYGGDDDVENPESLVLAPDGSLYGAARKDFHYDPKSQQFSLLDLKPGTNAPSLMAGFAPDGSIVGVSGGSSIVGGGLYVVSVSPDGSNYISLDNGQNVRSGQPVLQFSQIIAGKDGIFFALSTVQGKTSVVKFKSLKDTPTVVHKFVASPTDGNRPDANLVLDKQGNLYGSTAAGGMSQNGVIYKISADGSNYQVVYNPDKFAFTKVFVPGDDGMLYGISKDGLLQLAPDGSGKAPTTLVPFDGAAYTSYRGATPNIVFHDGAVYGLHNKAIYKVTLPRAGGGSGGAAPSVAIQQVQPPPLAAETVAFTDPSGKATSGAAPAAESPTGNPPAAGNITPAGQPGAGQPGAQPTSAQPTPAQPPVAQQPPARGNRGRGSRGNDAINRANDAANQIRGLLGR